MTSSYLYQNLFVLRSEADVELFPVDIPLRRIETFVVRMEIDVWKWRPDLFSYDYYLMTWIDVNKTFSSALNNEERFPKLTQFCSFLSFLSYHYHAIPYMHNYNI